MQHALRWIIPFNDHSNQRSRLAPTRPLGGVRPGSHSLSAARPGIPRWCGCLPILLPPGTRQPGWFSRRCAGKVTTPLPARGSHGRSAGRRSRPPASPTRYNALCSHHVCVARGKPIPGRTELADKPTNHVHNLTPQHILSTPRYSVDQRSRVWLTTTSGTLESVWFPKTMPNRGAWVAQSIKHLDFGSSHDPRVVRSRPGSGSALGLRFSPSAPPHLQKK